MMKRTLGPSRALSEQANKRTRKRKVIRLGFHDFPPGPVSPVDTFVGCFVVGDPCLTGIPFEPIWRVLHGDVAQQDGFGHWGCKVNGRKQPRPVPIENSVNECIMMANGFPLFWPHSLVFFDR
jgi:hypothetical protein